MMTCMSLPCCQLVGYTSEHYSHLGIQLQKQIESSNKHYSPSSFCKLRIQEIKKLDIKAKSFQPWQTKPSQLQPHWMQARALEY